MNKNLKRQLPPKSPKRKIQKLTKLTQKRKRMLQKKKLLKTRRINQLVPKKKWMRSLRKKPI